MVDSVFIDALVERIGTLFREVSSRTSAEFSSAITTVALARLVPGFRRVS